MSKTLKNLIFLISILYAVSIEPKFIEKEQYFKPFVSVPLISKPQIEEERQISVFAQDNKPKVQTAVKCLFLNGYDVYDISGIADKNSRHENLDIKEENQNCDIYFNICYNLKKESGMEKKQAYMKVGNETYIIGGNINDGNKWNLTTCEGNNGKKDDCIEIKVNKDNEEKNKNNSLTYYLKCKGDNVYNFRKNESSVVKNELGGYNVTLIIESTKACVKYSFYFIIKFIEDHYIIFGIILIVFGLFNCLCGKRMAKITSLILCIFTVTILVLVFGQYVLPSGCADWVVYVLLSVGIILGIVAGYFAYRHNEKVIAFLVGGICGFFLGQFLYGLFGNRIPVNGTVIKIVFVVVSIGVLLAIAYFFRDKIVIIGTSFIGAYCFIRGISLFAGHFPDEFKIADLVTSGEDNQIAELLTWHAYVYLTFIVIVTILSVIFQIKFNKEKEGEELKSSDKY